MSETDLAKRIADLAPQLANGDIEVSRTVKRELWKCVRHAGRPGAETERQIVVTALAVFLGKDQPGIIHREVLWMLSEIGGPESVEPIASLLSIETAREDARLALERIPGKTSLAALEQALETAPPDFKPNLAQSLRARGEQVSGHPCQKLTPTKETKVVSG